MPFPLLFIDLETLGTSDDAGVFEYASIDESGKETYLWLPISELELRNAEEGALRTNRYYKRRATCSHTVTADEGARIIAETTNGMTLAGNNVGPFDHRILRAWLMRHGYPAGWSYRTLDVVDYAAGALGLKAPWGSNDVAKALGLPESKDDERHTAMADTRWGKLVYETARALKTKHKTTIMTDVKDLLAGRCMSMDAAQFETWASTLSGKIWPEEKVKK